MKFISTRGGECVTGAQAIAQGIAKDGGLFVPETFPSVSEKEMEEMLAMNYAERAACVLHKFLDDYDFDGLKAACEKAYSKFDEGDAAPLVKIDDSLYMLELFHGPTCAFKDLALTLLPYLLREGCNLCGIKEQVLILVATSGDTGKAALEGFKDAEGVKIMVFYPSDGVSKMQKLQMATQEGKNVNVLAVRGNFDECQSAVKKIFTSEECKEELKGKGVVLSSANSINFGRLAPQIAYYFSAYLDLVSSEQIKMGDPVDFAVPTGNFGNILAAYYAKRMGLPVGKLICASNKNNVLTDFIRTGKYDKRREFFKTMSPSMDILISSNLERLLDFQQPRAAAVRAVGQGAQARQNAHGQARGRGRVRNLRRGARGAGKTVLGGLLRRGRNGRNDLRIFRGIPIPDGYAYRVRDVRRRQLHGGGGDQGRESDGRRIHGQPVQVPAGRHVRRHGQRHQGQLQGD